MTVTLNLPPDIEQAFIGEAAARGLTPDEFVSHVLRDRLALADTDWPPAHVEMEHGIPVLHTGQPLALSVIADTLERVRQERDFGSFDNEGS